MANNLLERLNNDKYEYGGEVRGYKAGGKVARAMKISKARKDIRKRARKMKKKARLANIGSIVGEILGKGVKYIPGVGATAGRILSPIVSGVLAKYGAELGYGKKVGAGKDKWLSGYRDTLRQFETGTRGGFQERGYGAAIRGAGQELGKFGLEKFGTTDAGKAAAKWKAGIEKKYGFGPGAASDVSERAPMGMGSGKGLKLDTVGNLAPDSTFALPDKSPISPLQKFQLSDDFNLPDYDSYMPRLKGLNQQSEFIDTGNLFQDPTMISRWMYNSPKSVKFGGGGYANRVGYQEGGEAEDIIPSGRNIFGQPTEAMTQKELFEMIMPGGGAGLTFKTVKMMAKAEKLLQKGKQGMTVPGHSGRFLEFPKYTFESDKAVLNSINSLKSAIKEREKMATFYKSIGKPLGKSRSMQLWSDKKKLEALEDFYTMPNKQQGGYIDKYQKGGYVSNSLLHRVFGNKSNLY